MGRLGAGLIAIALLLAPIAPALAATEAPLHYTLQVALDPDTRSLYVSGTIAIPAGRKVRLRLDPRYAIRRWDADGDAVPLAERCGDARCWRISAPANRAIVLRVAYGGQLAALDSGLDHRQVLNIGEPLVARDGAFLPAGSGWYPEPDDGRIAYRIDIDMPAGFRAVVPGALEQESLGSERVQAVFGSRVPLPGIDLLAGPYVVAERMTQLPSGREVRLRTYFHAELTAFAQTYLDAAAAHLARYDRGIGPYAFASYSIVSSPLPVGFGMPGIAYLGKQVVRLPFIPVTSLRHEVLHDWWGNGVVPDHAQGNWAEGLTTLLADHAVRAEEGESQARSLRLGWLRDYAAVASEQDMPLVKFVSRRHGPEQTVGYHKTAFVFFMLRDLIGTQAFDAGLQALWREYRLRTAGWPELQRVFQQQGRRDLDFYFAQWLRRPGAPLLEIEAAKNEGGNQGYRVRIDLRQQGESYRLRVPLRIHHAQGHTDVAVALDASHAQFVLPIPAPPHSIEIDPDVRLFRRLHAEEIAPTLRQVFFRPDTRVALASGEPRARAAGLRLAQSLLEHGVRTVDVEQERVVGPLLIVGLHADVARLVARWNLEDRRVPQAEAGSAFAYATRAPSGQLFAIVSARDAQTLATLVRSLPHLGAQSYAVFGQGRSIARGVWPVEPKRYAVTE